MAVRLESLYKQVRDEDIKLLAGKKGLNRVVRWVHMVENMEISTFLEGQEIAFTTGIGLREEAELIGLVKGIYEHGASGVVINIGPFIEHIPTDIIDFGNQHDFPVFSVLWNVHMAEIMRIFCLKITESEKMNMELSTAVKNAIFCANQEDLYIEYLEKNGFHKNWGYCCCVIGLYDTQSGHSIERERWDEIQRRIENCLTHSYKRAFSFELEKQIVLLLAKYSDEKVKEAIADIRQAYMPMLLEHEVSYIGIGCPVKNARCIYKTYEQAKNTERFQKNNGLANQIQQYQNMGIYKLLMAVEDKEVVQDYCSETIDFLIQYDKMNRTDYAKVLGYYLECNGSVQDTADRLFVHRNTVNYKIHKIEELMCCNLSEMQTRAKFLIGYMLKKIS